MEIDVYWAAEQYVRGEPQHKAEIAKLEMERDTALSVVAAAIQIVAGFGMMDHFGHYLVGRAEYENLQRALEPYRETGSADTGAGEL